MKYKRLFQEAGNNLIICDIQPDYSVSQSLLHKLIKKIKNFNNILWLYNGNETVGTDDKESIINWINEYFDYNEQIINMLDSKNIEWFDKGYAFIRDVMDTGVMNDSQILQTIRYMTKIGKTDIRDLEEKDLKKLGIDFSVDDYGFYIPVDLIDFLKKYKSGHIVGGGKDECLKEVLYFTKAYKLGYKVDTNIIY